MNLAWVGRKRRRPKWLWVVFDRDGCPYPASNKKLAGALQIELTRAYGDIDGPFEVVKMVREST